jgi:hypothetical protein
MVQNRENALDTFHKIAQRYIAKLEESGILREEADTSRNPIFCTDEILQESENRFQNDHFQIPCTSPFGKKMTVSFCFGIFPKFWGGMETKKCVNFEAC